MKVEIVASRLFVDAFLREFIRTTVQFATWSAVRLVESVEVTLRRLADGRIRCDLVATVDGVPRLCVTAAADDDVDAIQRAADKLEVELFGITSPRRGGDRVAA
jgi:ribosome-associated translation inhibitor RaiA